MIDFKRMEEIVLPEFYGGRGELKAFMYVDDLNRILKGRLAPGATIGLHKHDTSSEIIFILSGSGKTICDGVEEYLSAGDCHYCKKGSEHTLINTSNEELVFFAVVPQQK